VLDPESDAAALDALRSPEAGQPSPSSDLDDADLHAGTLQERVNRVVASIIAPVLANDGGRLDILGIDEHQGMLNVRFVGSCANCPYSLLSMEQIVKPTLLAIPGIQRVVHRARARDQELAAGRTKPLIAATSSARPSAAAEPGGGSQPAASGSA
jgi:Fe-S cluster biogenesis protein NfuA